MSKFRTGNVVKHHGSIIIITEVHDDVTHWISFDSENCSGVTQNKTYKRDELCWGCGINDGEGRDNDCETCHGTGHYEATIKGMDTAKCLAGNVKEYILNRLTKNFEF